MQEKDNEQLSSLRIPEKKLICLISGAGEEESSDVNNTMKNLKNSDDYKNHVGGLSQLTWKQVHP